MVSLEALPPPYLKRNRTRQREKSGCDSGARIDFWSCPKLGPVYLEGWIFIPSPSNLSTSLWMRAALRKNGKTLGGVGLYSAGEKKDRQLRAVSRQHLGSSWVNKGNLSGTAQRLYQSVLMILGNWFVSIIWALLWSFSLCFFLLSYPTINHLLMTYYEAGTLMRAGEEKKRFSSFSRTLFICREKPDGWRRWVLELKKIIIQNAAVSCYLYDHSHSDSQT